MRRRACDGSQDQGAAKGSHSVTDVSRGRCGENKPHHQKTAQCRGLNLDVIDCRCTVCAKAPLASLPDGIYDAGDQQRARSDRGNARRFEDGKLPKLLRIKCHAASFGCSKATALIWIMDNRHARDFPYIRGNATSNSATLTALGGKP